MVLFIRYDDQPIRELQYKTGEPIFEFLENRLIIDLDDAEEEFAMEVYLLINGYEQIMEDDPRWEFILQEGWGDEAQLKYLRKTEGLLLPSITTRAELDRWEQDNIAEAEVWAFRRAHPDILTDGFARRLHKRMFGNVWQWAGLYRKTEKNIGLPAWQIATELRTLCGDCKAWVEHAVYPPDEIAVRFHHRLTAIHPFANGNGRHARLLTDILLVHLLKQPRFTWGSGNLVDAGECRKEYIGALRAADRYDYKPLLAFVRS